MAGEREIAVPDLEAGNRLDVFLARHLGLSRGYVRRALQKRGIRINGKTAQKGTILRTGDTIEVPRFRHPSEGPIATADPSLRVLTEAAGWVAVDKPAGWPTHPLDFDETGTALNAVLARYPEMQGVGEGGIRSGVVHRLDTDTSGVLVFAVEPGAWTRARAAFAHRRVFKRYVALVHGRFQKRTEIVLRLQHRGPHMKVVEEGGRASVTRFEPLEPGSETSLVEAYPVTGLMHQIRATLAHLGHPVVGDRLYGSPRVLDRHLLHASEIRIEDFSANSPVPSEITLGG
jgi:23S rRNA pseudouridine1911/1915/1917 synthase